MKRLFKLEFKKFFSNYKLLLLILFLLFTVTFVQFLLIKDGYRYYLSIEVFEESLSGLIPMIFPFIAIIIYSNNFSKEVKNNYISSVFSRVAIKQYIFVKYIVNLILTFGVTFCYILLVFIVYNYILPLFNIIEFSDLGNNILPSNTLSPLLKFGNFGYGLIYSIWVALNAVLYSSLCFILSLNSKNQLATSSIPILIYHIGNFVLPIIGKARYSPLISVFPFSVKKQPLFILLIPFTVLFMINIIFIFYTYKQYKKGENYAHE